MRSRLECSPFLAPAAALAAFPGGNGQIAYSTASSAAGAGIVTISPDGSGIQQLTDGYDSEPSWSADGRRLVFTRSEGGGAPFSIFTINADGGDLTHVVTGGRSPSFSPSGHRILFVAGDAIRTTRIDGTKSRRVLTRGEFGGHLSDPQYSPTGRRILFEGLPEYRGKPVEGLWSMRRNGSHLRRLTSKPRDHWPDFSPDGRHIAFVRSGTYKCCNRVFVMRADGSRKRPITSGFIFPAWSPAGDRIVGTSGEVDDLYCSDVYTISPTGSDKQRITDNCAQGGGFLGPPSWQPLSISP